MLSQVSRASRAVAARVVRTKAVQMRGFVAPTVTRRANNVQHLYLSEIQDYKTPAIKDSDAQGQVKVLTMPKTPVSPEEANLAQSLKEYSDMAVEIESQEASAQSNTAAPELQDWLEAEEDDDHHAH